jgi:hypothetical protein
MLRYHAWKQQQQQQQERGKRAAIGSSSSDAAAEVALPAALTALQPLHPYEGYCSTFPDCTLLPSAVREAKQLLSKGRAVDALHKLCPLSGLLLHMYTGRSVRGDVPAVVVCMIADATHVHIIGCILALTCTTFSGGWVNYHVE